VGGAVTAGIDPAALDFCYLTTTGRVSGVPHRIEIWFALHDDVVYLMSGGGDRSDWVLNLMAESKVTLELGATVRATTARTVDPGTDEDALARELLMEKYTARGVDDLGGWGRTALPIAIAWVRALS
jgi:deazaflavin-dependent oxidoreductase (nitroreductase family)